MATKKAVPERTEAQKIYHDGIQVTLGGETCFVRPLVSRDSREWRKKVGPFQASISKFASISSDNPEDFEKALTELLVSRIDQTIDLFFDYARDLDKEEVEAKATDYEIVKAFSEVCKYAFPFE